MPGQGLPRSICVATGALIAVLVLILASTRFLFGYAFSKFTLAIAHAGIFIFLFDVSDVGQRHGWLLLPRRTNDITPPIWTPVLTRDLVGIPLWPIPLLIVAIGILLVVRWHRTDALTCNTCGYCLRGNVSGTCPECGIHVD
jgi:hypothetical protein